MITRADRRGVTRRGNLFQDVAPASLVRYYLHQLPAASLWTGAQVYVLDEVGGAVTCFSDGVYWRRTTDFAIASAITAVDLYSVGAATAFLNAQVGPFMVAAGAATGTFTGASYAGGALSAAAMAVATLATPPKVPADVSATAAATANMTGATRAASALSAAGAATATLEGVAA